MIYHWIVLLLLQNSYLLKLRFWFLFVSLQLCIRLVFCFLDTQTVWISVEDVNDNQPRFLERQYEVSIPESTPVGGSVVTVSAEDRDEGENALRTYTIVSSNDFFYMDSIYAAGTGVAKVKKVNRDLLVSWA